MISSSLSSKSRSASAPPAKQASAPPGRRTFPRRTAAAWLKIAWNERPGVETARKSSQRCGSPSSWVKKPTTT
nr:hypothetical protein [Nocardioides silvaticus]